jgi:thiamine-phosphate pyrophosphorylase
MKTSFMLITPRLADLSLLPGLQNALESASFASVLLDLAPIEDKQRLRVAQPFIEAVQQAGAAALVEAADPRFAARAGADGLHRRYQEEEAPEMARIRPERILGFGGLKNRDDAMSAGEMADYVLFGEPALDGFVPPLATTVERCGWWAEIFETPCIGYAPDAEAARAIAATRAEFVALGPWAFDADLASLIPSITVEFRRK